MEEEPNRSAVEKMKFSRDGSKLAVARESGQIEMWTVSNEECQWSIIAYCSHLAFSANDSKLACKEDNNMIALNAESGEECNSDETFDFESTYDHVHSDYVS